MIQNVAIIIFSIGLAMNAFATTPLNKRCNYRSANVPWKMALKEATFGMGCFWSPQKSFESMKGVTKTIVGYTGCKGKGVVAPTYQSVCAGDGYVEAVRVQYNDEVVTYNELLDEFWEQDIDTMSRQVGQYSSHIWVHDESQKEEALSRIKELKAQSDPRSSIPVISPKEDFFVAEGYHQNYWKKQIPRYASLFLSLGIDLWQGLDPTIYKIGALFTLSYIAIIFFERIFENKVVLLQ